MVRYIASSLTCARLAVSLIPGLARVRPAVNTVGAAPPILDKAWLRAYPTGGDEARTLRTGSLFAI